MARRLSPHPKLARAARLSKDARAPIERLGRRTLSLLLGALAACTIVPSPPPITAASVWRPDPALVQQLREQCSYIPWKPRCFADGLGAFGAPEVAVDAAAHLPAAGFIRAVRTASPVSVAYVDYVYRANKNAAWLLVNGKPPIVDVDDRKLLDVARLRLDPAYAQLLAAHPAADLWPGDRYDEHGPEITAGPDGGERFIVDYRVQECHACRILAGVRYAFDFAASGRFLGAHLLAVTPLPPPK
jgi:hypothetical protein